jgi:hypothetical protein
MLTKSALSWDITQRRVVILYRRFATTYRSHLQGSRNLKRRRKTTGGTDTVSRNLRNIYHPTLRNILEERTYQRRTGLNYYYWIFYKIYNKHKILLSALELRFMYCKKSLPSAGTSLCPTRSEKCEVYTKGFRTQFVLSHSTASACLL